MQHNKMRNLTFKEFPGAIVTKTNNYQMARTACKIRKSCRVFDVKLIEQEKGVTTKYAFVKTIGI